ncbi:MAG: lyase family protein [Candidatus Caldarchaeum sp.]|nr:lyase family protein [Candidatus Caldarchaeum sp.]MDW8434624.1 lyase family protein [Candidatus Caldarchaeum sp.]
MSIDAITPIDGRYRDKLQVCSEYFSEKALIRHRLVVEAKYLRAFLEAVGRKTEAEKTSKFEEIFAALSTEEAEEVKKLEVKLGHDVVAATAFFEKKLEEEGLSSLKPFVHFGLTSEDVNNIAYALAVKSFIHEILIPEILTLVEKLVELAENHASTPFLARTHGQPAVPTSFGSFIANYAYRTAVQTAKLKDINPQAKIGGAVGDLSALAATYPEIDWQSFAEKFITSLGLEFNPASTQILPHERTSEILQTVAVIDSVLANLCRDMWLLGALGLIEFRKPAEQVHSSTMPQKRNPLLFENAEGCFDLAANMLNYMSSRLLSSRLHRDLSDSVIKRFYGTGFALSLLGVKNTAQALNQITVNREAMEKEVETHPETMAEIAQLILRKHNVPNAYEAAAKGIHDIRQTLVKHGVDPNVIDPTKYIQAAQKKAETLIKKTRNIAKTI